MGPLDSHDLLKTTVEEKTPPFDSIRHAPELMLLIDNS